jgi:ferredoxin
MEKVKVDSERCLRCGACIACAPENFDYGDDGESVVINDTVTDEVRQAVDMCPVSAIEIVEEEEEEVQAAA